jgi:hypothetical protein
VRLADLLFTYWWLAVLFIGLIALISLIILACCAWIILQLAIDMWQQRTRRKRNG